MSDRHEAREWAVQFLFQRDFNHGDMDEALADFWAACDPPPKPKPKAFAESLIRGVLDQLKPVDSELQKYAEHWDVRRMGALDRNAMRLGAYEMLYRPDIPPVVSINEAVQIAKDFSSLESSRFVNGILDEMAKHLGRPARCAANVKGPMERESGDRG
jgi:N utilization substance protein B